MSLMIGYISAFDGTTLHNGTTLLATDEFVVQASAAVVRYVTLADGSLYDMDGTDDNVVRPASFTSSVLIVQTSASNLQTAVDTIVAKVGQRGTLSGVEINTSTTVTCTARLERTEHVPLTSDLLAMTTAKLRLHWRPLTNWA